MRLLPNVPNVPILISLTSFVKMLGNQLAATMSKVVMRPLAPREAEWNIVCKSLTRLMSDLGK